MESADDEAARRLSLKKPNVNSSESARVVGLTEAKRGGAAGPYWLKVVKAPMARTSAEANAAKQLGM